MSQKIMIALCATLAVLLSACSSPSGRERVQKIHGPYGAMQAPAVYVVQPGDTLFAISWRHGLDQEQVIRWNGISNPDRILAGQRLQLRPPRGTPAPERVIAPAVTQTGQSGWIWPTRGKVTRSFDAQHIGGNGIQIAGRKGQAIRAVRPGAVVYSGTGMVGFGHMVIIKHDGSYLSAYGFLGNVAVREGQSVKQGQTIASMGINAQSQPALHFEVRQKGQPVNPLAYIGSVYRGP